MESPVADALRQLYTELQMERDGLFAAVARAYRCLTVLDVLRLIHERRRHARPPHVRFLPLDFTRPLPLRDASFDLVLALHAGGIACACGRYLGPGGLLVGNNHHDDAGQAATDAAYRLVAVLHEREARYVDREQLDGYLVPRPAPDPAYVREPSPWPMYTRTADSYVFCWTNVRAS